MTILAYRPTITPVITDTPGWRPCPITWCAGNCTGGETHHVEGRAFITDRHHRLDLAAIPAVDRPDGGTAEVAVYVLAVEDRHEGVYTGVEIVVEIAGMPVTIDPAGAAKLRAALEAAEQLYAPAPEVTA